MANGGYARPGPGPGCARRGLAGVRRVAECQGGAEGAEVGRRRDEGEGGLARAYGNYVTDGDGDRWLGAHGGEGRRTGGGPGVCGQLGGCARDKGTRGLAVGGASRCPSDATVHARARA